MKHTVVTETATARDFLKRAIQTMNDRGKQYDSPGGERYSCLPGFPRAIRIGGKGHPRYKAADVIEWIEGQREKS